jgi:hypothetical protein
MYQLLNQLEVKIIVKAMVSDYDTVDLLVRNRKISQLREVPKALATLAISCLYLCEKQINNILMVLVSVITLAINYYNVIEWIIRSHDYDIIVWVQRLNGNRAWNIMSLDIVHLSFERMFPILS